MKLGGSVTLGIVVSVILYCLITYLWLIADFSWGPEANCGTLWFAFLVLFPIALFLGSILAGILSFPSIDFKWELFYFEPGLCLAGLCIVGSLFTNLEIGVYVIIMGLYWYLVSLAGTGLGYFLRSRIRRHRSFE